MLRTRPVTSLSVSSRLEGGCVVCGEQIGEGEGESVKLSTAWLRRCASCASWIYFPRPDDRELAALHNTAEYFEHPYFRARRDDKNLYLARCREIFAIIAQVLPVESLRGERVLDVGCDTGSFLVAASECYGIVPFGLDISSRAVQAARARGLEVFHGFVGDAPADFTGFNVVTAIDVLEHHARPDVFLRQLHKRMSSGGILYLQTPNFESVVYRLGRRICNMTKGRPREAIERLFPDQHVQYFSQPGLRLLAERCGFQAARLETRLLPARDIVASPLVRAGLTALQGIDWLRHQKILHCAVLRKPM